MFWKRIFSAISVISLFHFSLPQIQGDSLYLREDGRAGWIVSLDDSGVTYRAKCQGNDKSVDWDSLEGVIFDNNCDSLSPRQWPSFFGNQSISPMPEPLPEPPSTLCFSVVLRSSETIIAKDTSLDSEFFYLTTLKTNNSIKCPANQLRNLVRSVRRGSIYIKDIHHLKNLTYIPRGFSKQ
jgi:hypothetical protein